MGSEKKQTSCRRAGDPVAEKETSFPYPVVQGGRGQPEAKVDIKEACCQQDGCETGYRGPKQAVIYLQFQVPTILIRHIK